MRKKIKKVLLNITTATFLIAAIMLFTASLFSKALAQEKSTDLEVVSMTGLKNMKLNQNDHKISISFDINNYGNHTENDVNYAVDVYPINNKNKRIGEGVFHQLFTKNLSVERGKVIHQEQEIILPSFLRGKYEVRVALIKKPALILSSLPFPSHIQLKSDEEGVLIGAGYCYLNVQNQDKKFNLNEGIDINPDEKLMLSCNLDSFFKKTESLTPHYKIYYRNKDDKKIFETKSQKIKISEGINKISLLIPIANEPQAYDTELSLFKDGKLVSNKIYVHYVVRGKSASISNVIFKNDYSYKKGNTINFDFYWVGSADQFSSPKKRGGKTELKDVTGVFQFVSGQKKCSKLIKKTLNSNKDSISIKLTSDCSDPKLFTRITNKGKILDERIFTFHANNNEFTAIRNKNSKVKNIAIYGLLGIFIIIIIAMITLKNKKNKNLIIFILIFTTVIFGGFSLNPKKTNASVYTAEDDTCHYITDWVTWGPCIDGVQTGINTEGVSKWASVPGKYCYDAPNTRSCSTSGGSSQSSQSVNGQCSSNRYECNKGTPTHKDSYFDGSSTNYVWRCEGENNGTSASCSIKEAIPVNGECGSAYKDCDSGELGAHYEGEYDYHWNCDGKNGGTTDYCRKNKPVSSSDGECSSAKNRCTNGGAVNFSEDASYYYWDCVGPNGGAIVHCKTSKSQGNEIVNGKCGSTHYKCESGDSANAKRYLLYYYWSCIGSNGGSTDMCQEDINIQSDGQCSLQLYQCENGFPAGQMESNKGYYWQCQTGGGKTVDCAKCK